MKKTGGQWVEICIFDPFRGVKDNGSEIGRNEVREK